MTSAPTQTPVQDQLALLQAKSGCTPVEAARALQVAAGNLERAEVILPILRTNYLFVGATIEERSKAGATEGIIVAIWDADHPKPLFCTVIMTTSSMGEVVRADLRQPLDWSLLQRSLLEKLTGYDRMVSHQLEEHLKGFSFPGTLQSYLNQPKPTLTALELPNREVADLDSALLQELDTQLRKQISYPFDCRICWAALSGVAYADLADSSAWGLPLPTLNEQPSAGALAASKPGEPIQTTIHLRGTPVIDTVEGMVLDDIRVGDKVAVQITDHSPIAVTLGDHLGLRKSGSWLPAWGVVRKIDISEGGNVRLNLAIAQRVQCNVQGLGTIRVRVQPLARIHEPSQRQHRFPVGAVLGLGILLVLGLVTILVMHAHGTVA